MLYGLRSELAEEIAMQAIITNSCPYGSRLVCVFYEEDLAC